MLPDMVLTALCCKRPRLDPELAEMPTNPVGTCLCWRLEDALRYTLECQQRRWMAAGPQPARARSRAGP